MNQKSGMREKSGNKADIKERTYTFALEIIKMASDLPKNSVGFALSSQVVRSGTSVGANVEEASGGFTTSDFIYHMNVAKKEARETKYWTRLIIDSGLLSRQKTEPLLQEAEEILKILTSIVKTSEENRRERNRRERKHS